MSLENVKARNSMYQIKEFDTKRKKCFLSLCFAVTIAVFTLLMFSDVISTSGSMMLPVFKSFNILTTFRNKCNTPADTNATKLILVYTSFFGDKPWGFAKDMEDYSTKCQCDFSNCKITYDANLFSKSDAVLFHARNMPSIGELNRLNSLRKPTQKWVYFVLENPGNAGDVRPLDPYFNWTQTYRIDSDAFIPYTRFKAITPDNNFKPVDYAKGKTKQVAWLVSHCGRERDRFVKKLEEHSIQVDVGGGCAKNFKNKLSCRERGCDEELKSYKFYLSAENGMCKDYITEKYFQQGFKGNTIPIVLGGANYSNPKLAIPGSFINPLDFKNMKEFADYLKMLDKNDDKYNDYFKWKSHYAIYYQPGGCEKSMCEMCQKLKHDDCKKDRSLSSQIAGDCDQPTRNFENWMKL